ncbi:MAG: response regulator SirA [Rickettsiales bacterium]|nr:response regulator SirA [Rickettsiales bacterium]|tara:strand:- start:402 stop:650 length:249 start_codon:yes stop_codon:yes gene_type:complete
MYRKKKEKMFLNLLDDKCPITFVKTKIALEKLEKGNQLTVHLNDKEALEGMPDSLNELGFKILEKLEISKGVFSLKIKHKTS